MKHVFPIVAMLVFCLMSCQDDDNAANPEISSNKVPSVVKNNLKLKFPNAKDVEWENEDTNYEVDFEIGDVDYQALIASNGTILKYKFEVLATALPATVLSRINTSYRGSSLDDAEILDVNGTMYYQVELDRKPKDRKLVFDINGEVVTTVDYYD